MTTHLSPVDKLLYRFIIIPKTRQMSTDTVQCSWTVFGCVHRICTMVRFRRFGTYSSRRVNGRVPFSLDALRYATLITDVCR